jgi:hypothetical protein
MQEQVAFLMSVFCQDGPDLLNYIRGLLRKDTVLLDLEILAAVLGLGHS